MNVQISIKLKKSVTAKQLKLKKKHKKYLSSVLTKSFLEPFPKRRMKYFENVFKIESREGINSIDHLKFTVSRMAIVLFLKNHIRYLNSVFTKKLLDTCSIRRKNLEKALKIKSAEGNTQTDWQTDTEF